MCDARIVYLFQTVQTIFIGFQRLFLNKIYIPFYKSQTSSLTTNIHAKLSYFFHKEACDQIIQPQGTAYGFFFLINIVQKSVSCEKAEKNQIHLLHLSEKYEKSSKNEQTHILCSLSPLCSLFFSKASFYHLYLN